MPVTEQPRFLLLENPKDAIESVQVHCPTDCTVVRAETLTQALSLLRNETFTGFLWNPNDANFQAEAGSLVQAGRILELLPDGVAVIDTKQQVLWANPTFQQNCGSDPVGRSFYEALLCDMLGPDYTPFQTALSGKKTSCRLYCHHKQRYVDLLVTPIQNEGLPITQLLVFARNITAQVQQQHKLEALYKAGRELANLSAQHLAEMSVEERIELLKTNIRKYTHDLLHYDVVEIRLLDRTTGLLAPLLQEGMTPEAAQRQLRPSISENGVTGHVAATGKSYLCNNVANDPYYLEGSLGARSSLTVPLIYQDAVIGTFNVESPKPEGFTKEDLQFTEVFGREIANALHTLELLNAEKLSATMQSCEAISREVALPVDEILNATTAVLDRYIGHDEEMAKKLRTILERAREIRGCIQKVGEQIAPASVGSSPGEKLPEKLKGLRVLLADNDERVRRMAHDIMGRWGCIVETAPEANEAITMARLGSYDAILFDIRLPDMSGYDLYCQLLQLQPKANFVMMTVFGYDASHSIVKARQKGLKAVLLKPFRTHLLREALEGTRAES